MDLMDIRGHEMQDSSGMPTRLPEHSQKKNNDLKDFMMMGNTEEEERRILEQAERRQPHPSAVSLETDVSRELLELPPRMRKNWVPVRDLGEGNDVRIMNQIKN